MKYSSKSIKVCDFINPLMYKTLWCLLPAQCNQCTGSDISRFCSSLIRWIIDGVLECDTMITKFYAPQLCFLILVAWYWKWSHTGAYEGANETKLWMSAARKCYTRQQQLLELSQWMKGLLSCTMTLRIVPSKRWFYPDRNWCASWGNYLILSYADNKRKKSKLKAIE